MQLDRRSMLRGLAASVPAAALATSAFATPAEAALIAHANQVEALSSLYMKALNRWCDLISTIDEARPSHPRKPPLPKTPAGSVKREMQADGTEIVHMVFPPEPPDIQKIEDEYKIAVAAWEAEERRLKDLHDFDSAEGVMHDFETRMEKAAEELTDMQAVSMAGVVAKTQAIFEVARSYEDNNWPAWLENLILSTLRDVVSAGEAA